MKPPLPFSATRGGMSVAPLLPSRLRWLTYTHMRLASCVGPKERYILDTGGLCHLPMDSCNVHHVCISQINNEITDLSIEVVL